MKMSDGRLTPHSRSGQSSPIQKLQKAKAEKERLQGTKRLQAQAGVGRIPGTILLDKASSDGLPKKVERAPPAYIAEQPELAFLKEDIHRAQKYGDLAVDVFGINPNFVQQKPPSRDAMMLIANSRRRKQKYKPIYVAHPDDVRKGTQSKFDIIKGSGETFFSCFMKNRKQRATSAGSQRSASTGGGPKGGRPKSEAETLGSLDDLRAKRAKEEEEKKKIAFDHKAAFGGLRMNITASAQRTLTFSDKVDEDLGVSDSDSDSATDILGGTENDKIIDFSDLIDALQKTGGLDAQLDIYNREEDESEQNLKKTSGVHVRTMHLTQHTKKTGDATELDRNKTKSISLGYVKQNVLYNSRIVSNDSLRTEIIRAQPRRRQITNVEHRLKSQREKDHCTTYYDGREWLRKKDEEEKAKVAATEKEKKDSATEVERKAITSRMRRVKRRVSTMRTH